MFDFGPEAGPPRDANARSSRGRRLPIFSFLLADRACRKIRDMVAKRHESMNAARFRTSGRVSLDLIRAIISDRFAADILRGRRLEWLLTSFRLLMTCVSAAQLPWNKARRLLSQPARLARSEPRQPVHQAGRRRAWKPERKICSGSMQTAAEPQLSSRLPSVRGPSDALSVSQSGSLTTITSTPSVRAGKPAMVIRL